MRVAETYESERPCKRGHYGPRYVANRECVACHAIRKSEWVRHNKDHVNAYAREYARDYRRKDGLVSMNIRITPELKNHIKRIADADGKSMTEEIKDLLNLAVNSCYFKKAAE